MASKKVNIDISTKANTAGAKQAAGAMDDLATSAEHASEATRNAGGQASGAMDNLAASTTRASSATKNVGSLAAQAGYQIQDFATQVSMGTSMFTAFAQNAPQFLGAFGPKGAIVGALVAVGAIVAKVAYEIVTGAGDAEEALEKTVKATEELQDKLIKIYETQGGEKARAAISSIERQSTLTNILRESELGLIDVKNSRIKTEEDLAKKQDDLTEKAIRYLAQIGQITNVEKALDELRKQSAARQKEASIADIEAGVEIEIARYNNIKQQRDDLDREVAQAENRIALLQKRQQEITAEYNRTKSFDERLIEKGLEAKDYRSPKTAELEGKLKSLEKQLSDLSGFVAATPERIGKLTEAAFTQAAKVEASVESARIQIEKIESEYKISEKAQAITDASQKMSDAAKAISSEIEKFEPISQTQEQAKSQLMQIVSDGQVTANEQQQVAASLSTLMGTLRAGQNTSISSLQELIRINNELASKLGQADGAIKDLRQRVNNLFISTR